jgi:hypothetical protein|tara:strand:+ start:2450 stop:2818 length:369 start_codon:yes stop_codon:yes gene_type:complete
MVGAIIRGVLKSKIKPKPKTKYPKRSKLKREAKVPTADKYLSRAAVLGGVRSSLMKKKPSISKFEAGVGVGGAGVLGTQAILKKHKAKKDAKAASDKKLKKATEKHKAKTQKKREKYGKHHG